MLSRNQAWEGLLVLRLCQIRQTSATASGIGAW